MATEEKKAPVVDVELLRKLAHNATTPDTVERVLVDYLIRTIETMVSPTVVKDGTVPVQGLSDEQRIENLDGHVGAILKSVRMIEDHIQGSPRAEDYDNMMQRMAALWEAVDMLLSRACVDSLIAKLRAEHERARDAFNDGIKENIERLAEETEMATHE